jgi:hypothetical protein
LTTFAMCDSSVVLFEDRTSRGERFYLRVLALIDVGLGQLERILNQLKVRIAFVWQ